MTFRVRAMPQTDLRWVEKSGKEVGQTLQVDAGKQGGWLMRGIGNKG